MSSRLLAEGAAAVVAVGLALIFLWFAGLDPSGQLPVPPAPATVSIFDSRGVLLYESLDPEHGKASYVPLAEMPANLVHAVVATEDASFYSNPGVDPVAILRAVIQNARSDEIVSGGSTITQQLARNIYMTPAERTDRSLGRKLRETGLALRLSARLSKDRVMEWYLNTVPFGHQSIGADAAARVYFGKRVRDLDLAESALLAGLPQAPSIYDPLLDLPAAKARQRIVLSLMARQGYITGEEAASAAAEPLQLAGVSFPIRAPHFVSYVQELMAGGLLSGVETSGGLRVFTTLDLGLQEMAEAAVRRNLAGLADRNVTNGALVALDPRSGSILAMVGSADFFDRSIDGQVNVATAARQPGSSIKPILYAAALEHGFTPATVLFDVPTSFLTADGKSYSPENYDRAWHGPVSVRDALANSYNLPAVKLLQQVGIPAFLDAATRAGLSTLTAKGAGDLSLALGSGEVRLLDLVSAYAAFDTGGRGRAPAAITRIEDSSGRVIWQRGEPTLLQVTTPQIAYLITDILSDNDARTPSFGSDSFLHLSRPAAAKTGTTTDWRDNWTVGYTPNLAAGVWVGNADNSPMRDVSGITGAAPIWHDFMEEALRGQPAQQFEVPPGLVRREVCAISGDLPSEWCPARRAELFVAGTEPTSTTTWYQPFRVDSLTGQLAGPDTPAGRVEQRVYLVLPPELQAWGRERGVPVPPAGPAAGADGNPGGVRLLLTAPADGTVFQISTEIPVDQQKLEVSAAGAGVNAARMDFIVDGVRIASLVDPPYQTAWQLAPGRHVFAVVAIDSGGGAIARDEATITVEGPTSGP